MCHFFHSIKWNSIRHHFAFKFGLHRYWTSCIFQPGRLFLPPYILCFSILSVLVYLTKIWVVEKETSRCALFIRPVISLHLLYNKTVRNVFLSQTRVKLGHTHESNWIVKLLLLGLSVILKANATSHAALNENMALYLTIFVRVVAVKP